MAPAKVKFSLVKNKEMRDGVEFRFECGSVRGGMFTSRNEAVAGYINHLMSSEPRHRELLDGKSLEQQARMVLGPEFKL